jgi:hypothetical protein
MAAHSVLCGHFCGLTSLVAFAKFVTERLSGGILGGFVGVFLPAVQGLLDGLAVAVIVMLHAHIVFSFSVLFLCFYGHYTRNVGNRNIA